MIDLSRWKFTDDLILVLDIAVAEGCIDKVCVWGFVVWCIGMYIVHVCRGGVYVVCVHVLCMYVVHVCICVHVL